MSEKTVNGSGGLGFFGALFLLFLCLKLTGVITWSWWFVTMPLWGGIALVLGVLLTLFLFAAIATAIQRLMR